MSRPSAKVASWETRAGADGVTPKSKARRCEDHSPVHRLFPGSNYRTVAELSREDTKRHSVRDERPHTGQFSCAAVRVS